MAFIRRALACALVLAIGVSGSAALAKPFRDPVTSNRPSGRASGRASGVPGTVPPARAFAQVVGASVLAGAAPISRAVVRPAPSGGIRGIDVSHYQGRIDWKRVARSGHDFAIAKATEGRTYVDRTYLRNKVHAEANDLAFGAYHFARPDPGPQDAIREANHFLDVARLEPGNVIPVLDLETTGGLSKRRLTRWILTWLRRVRQRLGVRPMVYTSPFGWTDRTGNTTRIVEAGYDLLWVAHWGVPEPSLPARNWGGHGWTVWQRSDCGSVPGIRGCVDVNRLAGTSLGSLTISVPDTAPPSVRVSRPASFTSPVVVSFDEVVGGVGPRNVFLKATQTGRHPSMRLACRSGIGSYVDCTSGDVRKVLVTSRRPLVPGEAYEAVVNPATASSRAVTDRAGNRAATVARTFTVPTELEQGSAPIAYARPRAWRILSPRDGGGRVAASGVAGASAELTFRGTGLVWTTVTGPNHGLAEIWLDGELARTVDTYARERTAGVRFGASTSGSGVHTVRIVVLGERSERASGTMVAIDRLDVLQRRAVPR